jgi:hypothetical protein
VLFDKGEKIMPRYIVDRSRDVRIQESLEFEAADDADAASRGRKIVGGYSDETLFGSCDWQVQSVDPMDDDDEHVVVVSNTGKTLFDNYKSEAE